MAIGSKIIAKPASRKITCRGGCGLIIPKDQVVLGFPVHPYNTRHFNYYCLECVRAAMDNALHLVKGEK